MAFRRLFKETGICYMLNTYVIVLLFPPPVSNDKIDSNDYDMLFNIDPFLLYPTYNDPCQEPTWLLFKYLSDVRVHHLKKV